MRKKIIGIFVCMLLIATVLPVSGNVLLKRASNPASVGDILYVGGNGTGNYTKIQDAINDSEDGDTVFVYDDSAPYIENIIVDKSIHLIGEDRNTTFVLSGKKDVSIFTLLADYISLEGFSIRINYEQDHSSGIEVFSDYNIITNNNVSSKHRSEGITLTNSDYNTVVYNIVTHCFDGILVGESFSPPHLSTSNHNNISNNYVENNANGIRIVCSFHNIISENLCFGNYGNGIWIGETVNNTISYNILSRNTGHAGITAWRCYNSVFYRNNFTDNTNIGLQIRLGGSNEVFQNNFFNNSVNAVFRRSVGLELVFKVYYYFIKRANPDEYDSLIIRRNNTWDENYWNGPVPSPYVINGSFFHRWDRFITIPLINYDWHPAQEPYDI